MRELELIEALERGAGPGGPRVVRWLGDDAAVVRGRGYAVTSVDTMVDGVHFRPGQLTPEEIGHRALGGRAVGPGRDGRRAGEAYLALGLPAGTELADARWRWSAARRRWRRELGVTIAGGDVTARRRADRVVHGRRLGAMTPASWSAATARGRATSWRSPARSAAPARGSPCSRAGRRAIGAEPSRAALRAALRTPRAAARARARA